MQEISRLPGRRRKNLAHCPVDVLQGIEGKARLAVVVLQKPDQFPILPGWSGQSGKLFGYGADQAIMIRRTEGHAAALLQHQVVDQADAAALRHRVNLVLAVRVEGDPGQFGRIAPGHVDHCFPITVAHDQFSAPAGHRQGNHQGRHHALRLLGVPVRPEKTAGLIDQQLVQFRIQPVSRASEALGGPVQQSGKRAVPCPSGDIHHAGTNLTAVPHPGVNNGVRPPAVGRGIRGGDQFLHLRPRNRQGKRSDFSNLDAGGRRNQAPMGAVIPGSVHRSDQLLQPVQIAVG